MSKIKTREEIDIKDQWNLRKIFREENDFEKLYKQTKKLIMNFLKYESHVMDNAKTLYEVLLADNEISRRVEKLYCYASMMCDQDVSNNPNQERLGRVMILYDLACKNTYFVRVELLKVDYSVVEKFYKEEPKLLEHEKNLKDIFKYKKYTLSDSEEKLLSSLGKAFGNDETTFGYLTDSDLSFGKITDEDGKVVELTDTNYSIYIRSKNRSVRKEAFETLYKVFKQFRNTLTSTLDGHIKQNVTMSRIKGYENAFMRSLYSDDIDIKVYNTLVETVHSNLDVYQKYFKMKKKILGYKDMHMWDAYVDLLGNYKKKYSFLEAKDIIFKALNVLGEDYLNDLEKAFSERWIDIYPNKNKRSGAYSGGSYDTYPYLLLNFQGQLDDVSTIAHELGHSMHSYYTRSNQPYQYGDYPIFVAEVASTTNELILADYLIKNSKNDYEKLFAMNHLLELFKATIYRQTMFEEFEKYAYDLVEKDDVISADKLSSKYLELNKLYFGDSVISDELISYEWEKVPHFYYNFYVYKYATSLSAACMIATRILNHEEGALESYLRMLKNGSRLSPLDTLKMAGVDMKKKEVYESAIKMFDQTILEYQELMKKMK